jgi:hypothetical protein
VLSRAGDAFGSRFGDAGDSVAELVGGESGDDGWCFAVAGGSADVAALGVFDCVEAAFAGHDRPVSAQHRHPIIVWVVVVAEEPFIGDPGYLERAAFWK